MQEKEKPQKCLGPIRTPKEAKQKEKNRNSYVKENHKKSEQQTDER